MFKTFSAAAVLFLSAEAVRMPSFLMATDDAVADVDVADTKTFKEKLDRCRAYKKKLGED